MTALTAITANTAWDTWYEYSDRACHDTAKVWRWYVQAFFSPEANARYQWVGELIGCCIALAYLYTKRWVDAQVEQGLQQPDHIADDSNMVDPFSPAENPHYAEVLATLTVAQLRPLCQSAGIRWRNAHGVSKHLSKAEMIAALTSA